MPKSFLNNPNVARGLRNNNPGNLIASTITWQGKIPLSKNTDLNKKFEQFENVHYGIRAMLKDLINDINKGQNTLKLLITEYAPPKENDTKAYIDSVARTLGVTPTQRLTQINSKFLLNLVRAILKVELGKDHSLVTDSDIIKSITMLGDVSTPNLKVTIDKFALAKQYILPALITIGLFFYSYVTITI